MQNVLISGLMSVIIIFALMMVGIFSEKKGWFNNGEEKLLAKLVVNVALPAKIIHSFTQQFTKTNILDLGISALTTLIITFTMLILAVILAKVLKVDRRRKGVFAVMIAFPNITFIGLPIVLTLFGDEVTAYAMATIMVNVSLFWTVGVFLIKGDSADNSNSKFELKNILPPAIVASIISIILIFAEIQLPKSLLDVFGYLSGLVTPLALIFAGVMISRQKIKDLMPDRDLSILLVLRFIIAPLICFAAVSLMKLSALNAQTIVVQLSMPVMTQISIVALMYGSDYNFAVKGYALSTILLFAFIPIYVVILNFVF